LKIGLDTRQDGLPWVLTTLIILGEDINVNRLPKFLDSQAIKYLFDITNLKIEFDKLKNLSKELLVKRKDILIQKEK